MTSFFLRMDTLYLHSAFRAGFTLWCKWITIVYYRTNKYSVYVCFSACYVGSFVIEGIKLLYLKGQTNVIKQSSFFTIY